MNTTTKSKARQFDASFIGCVIDGSADSADYINGETIDFAATYAGFVPADLPDEDHEDYGQILSEDGDDAVFWLNEQDLLPYCSFYFEDNSLFYGPSIESAKEGVDFVSRVDREYPPDFFVGEWLHVSDHGNATLYVRNKAGEDKEIWGVV